MGSIHSYQAKAGKRYYVRYRKPDGTNASKRGFTRKKDAEDYIAAVTADMRRGEYVDPTRAHVALRDLGEVWMAEQKLHLKPSTFHSVESAWRVHVEPRWGNWNIDSIQHGDVRKWVAGLSADRSATTVKRAHGILAGILDTAVKDRRLSTNPARDLPLPRKGRKPRVYLTHEQVEQLAAASQYPEVVLFLAYTGLRWGEATGLRVRHIDTTRRRVFVEENAVSINGKVHVGTPKTHRTRTVPYPSFLHEFMVNSTVVRRRDALVFGDGTHHLVLPNSQNGWFAGAVRRCQRADPDFPRITPHDLRHTTASLAISAGANVKAVQRMLGHASAAMTLDTYADLFDDDLDAVSTALDRARSSSFVPKLFSKADLGE